MGQKGRRDWSMIVLLVQLACWHLIAFALVSPRISYAATTIDLSKEFARSSGSSGDAFIQRLASQEPRIRSTLVLEKGKIVSEYYRSDIDPNENHQVWSATKSWMGMLVGMLVKDGLLNTDETLGDVFSDDIWMNIADSQFRKNVTIEELLTMSSGFFDEWERGYQWTSYENGTAGGANVTDSLQFPLVGERGTFQYLGTSQILSYVLDSRTNLTPFEYLKEKLLPSIGIDATNISWWANVDQMSYGYHGLNLTPEQMAKFGQLYLQEGMVGSTVTPLVDPEWIKLSSSPKINVRSRIFTDFSVDYGYLMWIFNMPNRTDIASFYCAMGIGGQVSAC